MPWIVDILNIIYGKDGLISISQPQLILCYDNLFSMTIYSNLAKASLGDKQWSFHGSVKTHLSAQLSRVHIYKSITIPSNHLIQNLQGYGKMLLPNSSIITEEVYSMIDFQ